MNVSHDLFGRCCAAERRFCERNGFVYQQPSLYASEHDPRTNIVTLENGAGVIARFKVGEARITRLQDQREVAA